MGELEIHPESPQLAQQRSQTAPLLPLVCARGEDYASQ
jgi:hypothetical protein